MSLIGDVLAALKATSEWNDLVASARRAPELERRIAELEKRLAGNHGNEVCNHCGSPFLKRTGTRKVDGPFAALGVREAVYCCADCGKETAVELAT